MPPGQPSLCLPPSSRPHCLLLSRLLLMTQLPLQLHPALHLHPPLHLHPALQLRAALRLHPVLQLHPVLHLQPLSRPPKVGVASWTCHYSHSLVSANSSQAPSVQLLAQARCKRQQVARRQRQQAACQQRPQLQHQLL